MGKIVKYCAACDESFAEKFGFCPNCGQVMTAFEMNPVTRQAVVSEASKTNTVVEEPAVNTPAPIPFETAPKIEPSPTAAAVAVSANQARTFSNEMKTENVVGVSTEDAPTAPKTFAAAAGTNGNGNGNYQVAADDFQAASATPEDDDFHVTVIEEKNSKQRNGLLLASLALMVTLALGSTVYSLFDKDLDVGAIEDGNLFAFVVVDGEPMELEKPKPEKPGDEGSGGGGGGRKDNAPISKGELPPQFKDKPLLTPSKEDISVTNPSLAVMRGTRGKDDIIPKERSAVNGDRNSTNLTPSNGLGPDNLGMGQNGSAGVGDNGRDGAGSRGTGGRGNGPGNDYGDSDNIGPNGYTPAAVPKTPPAAPVKPAGVTTKVKIISKPKPGYTNEARQNQVTGTVRLRVVFTASGQIGSVSSVSGLPNGLTEQAISAAKGIRFEPAMKNGVAVSSQSIVEYTFSIY